MNNQIVPCSNQVDFLSFHPASGWRTHYCAAWAVENGKASPILFPQQPKGSRVFLGEGISNIRDIETGEVFPSREHVEAKK